MISLGIRTVRNTEIYDFGVSNNYLIRNEYLKRRIFNAYQV